MQPDLASPPIQTASVIEWVEEHLPVLRELVQIGMELARAIRQQVIEPSPDKTTPDAQAVAIGFGRIARAVRQTVALGTRLAEEQRKLIEAKRVRDAQTAGGTQPTPERRVLRVLAQQCHIDLLLPELSARAENDATEEAGFDLQWLVDLAIRVRSPGYDAFANDPSVAETVERLSHAVNAPFDPAVWYDKVPKAGSALHPAVAATIAHRRRQTRRTQQEHTIDLLADIFENPEERHDKAELDDADLRLSAAMERMEGPDYDPLVGERSIAEVVEQVSKLLGVPFDPDVWQEQVPEMEVGGKIRPLSWPSCVTNSVLAAKIATDDSPASIDDDAEGTLSVNPVASVSPALCGFAERSLFLDSGLRRNDEIN